LIVLEIVCSKLKTIYLQFFIWASSYNLQDTSNKNLSLCREARVLLHPTAYNAFLDIAITDEGKRAEARKI
jgi:hypothetical protein